MDPAPPSKLSEESDARWTSYLERYDQWLALYDRSLDNEAERNLLIAQDIRTRSEAEERNHQSWERQRRTALRVLGLLVGIIVLVALVILGVSLTRG
jgi:hypothetical protein